MKQDALELELARDLGFDLDTSPSFEWVPAALQADSSISEADSTILAGRAGQPLQTSRQHGRQIEKACSPLMGLGLAQAFTYHGPDVASASGLATWFAEILSDQMSWPQPELLNDDAQFVIAEMQTLMRGSVPAELWATHWPDHAWLTHVLDRFADAMHAIERRDQPINWALAARLRVMSVCLAADARERGRSDLVARLTQIAAGVTWLERRHTGQEPPTETIVLAR